MPIDPRYNSDPLLAPVVNCTEPDLGKGCTDPPVQCNNNRCYLEHSPEFYDSVGVDWLAAGGVTSANMKAWTQEQHGHGNALGTMTTQWNSRSPDVSGIPNCGEYGWNAAHVQRTAGCATTSS